MAHTEWCRCRARRRRGCSAQGVDEVTQPAKKLACSLVDARRLVGDLDDTVQGNRDNLDETLENIRATSQNLKQFSHTIKQRPNSLVFAKEKKDPVPPVGK